MMPILMYKRENITIFWQTEREREVNNERTKKMLTKEKSENSLRKMYRDLLTLFYKY